MAVLDPADPTEANVAVAMQSFSGIGIKSTLSSGAEANVFSISSSLGGVGTKSSIVLIDGLIDYTIIRPSESYIISEE